MRQIKALLCITLALSTSIIGFGTSRSPVQSQKLCASTVMHVELTPLDRAFLDALAILDQPNTCSRFFGTEASHVLRELSMKIEKRASEDRSIAFRMSGPFVTYVNAKNGVLYRLFETVEVNMNGAFFKSKVFLSDPFVPRIGSFPPNTRHARVLILLHELAHLIEGGDRKWLIPDDGGNLELSRSNTRMVESKCGPQIRTL